MTSGGPYWLGGGAVRRVGVAERARRAGFGPVLPRVPGQSVMVMAVHAGLTFVVSPKISSGCSKQLM